MKFKKTITALFLAGITAISCLVAGCGKKLNDTKGSEILRQEGTTHEREIKSTDKNLLKGGSTEYKILIPSDNDSLILSAKSELTAYFAEATGIKLETVEKNVTYGNDAKYISLGETEFYKGSGVKADYKELGTQGYIIRTVGNSLIIAGQSNGVLYGVYDLLNVLFGFDVYTEKAYYIDTGVRELKLPDVNVKEIPDIEYRIAPYGNVFYDTAVRRRMRMINDAEVFISGGRAHNMLRDIIDVEENPDIYDIHPKWFSGDRQQLCYTAHGDSAEYEKMVTEITESIKKFIKADPSRNAFSITQMDINVWCGCETCTALKKKYGTDSASQIMLVNDVAERVEKWLKNKDESGECFGREISFVTFAYHKTEAAPAKKNDDGTYSPIDERVVLRDNVSIWIAPISANFIDSVNAPENATLKSLFDTWSACAKSLFFWGYDTYFSDYMCPMDSYGSMQDMVKQNVKVNAKLMWAQASYNLLTCTHYDAVKNYIYSKLMWNCNADMNKCISDFFKGVYREAAPEMEKSFWLMRVQMKRQHENGLGISVWESIVNDKYWEREYLMEQLSIMEEAKGKIAKYAIENPDLYKIIMESIEAETISPRFLLIELYKGTFTKSEKAELYNSFAKDVRRLNINQRGENATMESYLKTLGL